MYRPIRICVKVVVCNISVACENGEGRCDITMTSQWARWRLKSPASPLFTQPFIQGADQRKHQSSTSLAFVRGIHRGPMNSPHKGPVTRKMFPFDDVIMNLQGGGSLQTIRSTSSVILCLTTKVYNIDVIRGRQMYWEHGCYLQRLLCLSTRFNQSTDHDNSVWGLHPLLGLYSISGKASYRQISWSLETARLNVIIIISLLNLTGLQQRCQVSERLWRFKPETLSFDLALRRLIA